MLINNKNFYQGKSLEFNVFKGNKLYQYNRGAEAMVITTLDEKISDDTFSIDAKEMDVLKKAVEPNVDYDAEKHLLKIKEKHGRFTLKTSITMPTDFNNENLKSVEVDLSILKKARKFTASSDTRPVLTSVNLNENGQITATDALVLYRYKANENGVENPTSINIPNSFIDLLNFDSEKIVLKYNQYCVIVEHGNITLVGRLISGEFPNVDRTINGRSSFDVEYDLADVKDIINYAVSNVGISKENNSKIILEFANDKLQVFGALEFESEVKCSYDQDYKIDYDSDVFTRMLNAIDNKSETFTLGFINATSPIHYRNENETIVITPIRR